jgi:hypothetical protein
MEQQKMHSRHLMFLVSACLLTIGCATLSSPMSDVFSVSREQPAEASKAPELAPETDVPSFVVEMRGSDNESQKFQRPLTDEATYIQGVLVQSNALKHFGRVKIQLWRLRPDGQGYHKLDIPYDRIQRTVPPGYDYAIREGDRLIFMKDESTVFDDMLGSLGGL